MILIGVDQGTTGTRTVAFDEHLRRGARDVAAHAGAHEQPVGVVDQRGGGMPHVRLCIARWRVDVGGCDRRHEESTTRDGR